ncbi:SRPBCC domain-containing protein [Phytoactinopolyspora alkaliphila]|uniref:SRPBCC domain-containing protein n=1 Tax=Phytoactinopolyspora alkaliphila TaxID=1783498 RepID=A0A6N9YIK9_9ACTN|nr:SRPBCC domain-containing protein [Phytoactinopolyspora alkaliphila]NED94699.1 SRPBCC domain-containing protein [Phytoactinopolyspora alkaliphila]
MGHHFDERHEAELDATPEQVWNAIATGPGIDSWFMGRNEVEPGPGGAVRMAFGGYTPEHRVTTWVPPERFAYRSDEAPDGRFVAFEFLLEGRDQGSTVVRMVTSGFLPGDDWEDEYQAMTKGGELFFSTLVEYLARFNGRAAIPVTAFGPAVQDWGQAWSTLHGALGLTEPITRGSTVRFTGPGSTPIDGTVYFVNADTLGISADDALYRFLKGFRGPMIAGHHLFSEVNRTDAETAWQNWLREVFG